MKRQKFFNSNTTTKVKIILSVVGIIFLALSIYGLKRYIPDLRFNWNSVTSYYAVIATLVSSMGFLLGSILILMHLNYENKWNQSLLILLIGFFLGVGIYNHLARILLITLLIDLFIFFIVVILFKLYVTMTTMLATFSFYVFIIFVGGLFLFRIFPNLDVNQASFLYIVITIYLIAYRLVGVKLNRFFISNVMGKRELKEEYDSKVLVSHINVIYIVIFILINVTGLIYKSGEYNFSNILNNCFITALALNQVKWHKLTF